MTLYVTGMTSKRYIKLGSTTNTIRVIYGSWNGFALAWPVSALQTKGEEKSVEKKKSASTTEEKQKPNLNRKHFQRNEIIKLLMNISQKINNSKKKNNTICHSETVFGARTEKKRNESSRWFLSPNRLSYCNPVIAARRSLNTCMRNVCSTKTLWIYLQAQVLTR
jgi:hypothetical protein